MDIRPAWTKISISTISNRDFSAVTRTAIAAASDMDATTAEPSEFWKIS